MLLDVFVGVACTGAFSIALVGFNFYPCQVAQRADNRMNSDRVFQRIGACHRAVVLVHGIRAHQRQQGYACHIGAWDKQGDLALCIRAALDFVGVTQMVVVAVGANQHVLQQPVHYRAGDAGHWDGIAAT